MNEPNTDHQATVALDTGKRLLKTTITDPEQLLLAGLLLERLWATMDTYVLTMADNDLHAAPETLTAVWRVCATIGDAIQQAVNTHERN